ncbi:hypothetical protein LBMAG53_07090 [Planctomycetota bacterium]|nr:hypothetical protein LBMAG53_07090 [Planctomycetota bacterium]
MATDHPIRRTRDTVFRRHHGANQHLGSRTLTWRQKSQALYGDDTQEIRDLFVEQGDKQGPGLGTRQDARLDGGPGCQGFWTQEYVGPGLPQGFGRQWRFRRDRFEGELAGIFIIPFEMFLSQQGLKERSRGFSRRSAEAQTLDRRILQRIPPPTGVECDHQATDHLRVVGGHLPQGDQTGFAQSTFAFGIQRQNQRYARRRGLTVKSQLDDNFFHPGGIRSIEQNTEDGPNLVERDANVLQQTQPHRVTGGLKLVLVPDDSFLSQELVLHLDAHR